MCHTAMTAAVLLLLCLVHVQAGRRGSFVSTQGSFSLNRDGRKGNGGRGNRRRIGSRACQQLDRPVAGPGTMRRRRSTSVTRFTSTTMEMTMRPRAKTKSAKSIACELIINACELKIYVFKAQMLLRDTALGKEELTVISCHQVGAL